MILGQFPCLAEFPVLARDIMWYWNDLKSFVLLLGCSYYIAQEFFDALPIHQFQVVISFPRSLCLYIIYIYI